MKGRRNLIATALAALAVLTAGCKKHEWRPAAGELIQFRAVSDFVENPETKTVYSGQLFTVEGKANKVERIDWVEGDNITIAYLSHTQGANFTINSDDYKITGVSNDGKEKSFATIAPTGGPYGGNGLKWQDNETHMFYACYPGVSHDSDYVFEMGSDGIVAKVPFEYPAAQVLTRSETDENVFLADMTYASMLYSDDGSGISLPAGREKVINLTFSPHFTAFEFQAAAEEGSNFLLKGFTLSSASQNISGRYLWTLGDDNEWFDDPVEGSVYKTVSVDFSSFGITLTDAQPVTFTVLTRGEEDWNDLTITFQIETLDGVTINRSLKLKNASQNYILFRHHWKHRIYGLRIPVSLEVGTLWYASDGAGNYLDGGDPFDGEI